MREIFAKLLDPYLLYLSIFYILFRLTVYNCSATLYFPALLLWRTNASTTFSKYSKDREKVRIWKTKYRTEVLANLHTSKLISKSMWKASSVWVRSTISTFTSRTTTEHEFVAYELLKPYSRSLHQRILNVYRYLPSGVKWVRAVTRLWKKFDILTVLIEIIFRLWQYSLFIIHYFLPCSPSYLLSLIV